MNRYRLEVLTSVDALRGMAAGWDDLWLRSNAPAPTSRAETAAQWIETFARVAPMHARGLRRFATSGRDDARRPQVRGPLELGTLAVNDWCDCGDLLLDPAANARRSG